MSVFNGHQYIDEQIKSLLGQTDVDLRILVRDDGSTDGTQNILDKWKSEIDLDWYSGNNLGPARSFLDLVKNAPVADYYAFCDQDDWWMPEKLAVAVKALSSLEGPALYCSNFQLADALLNPIPTVFHDPVISLPSFLVSNFVTGCTEVMNKKFTDILKGCDPDFLMMHDSWTAKACLAIGGNVIFDVEPHILYRQHGSNVIGGESHPWLKFRRRISSFFHPSRPRYREAMSIKYSFGGIIPSVNSDLLEALEGYYTKSLFYRIRLAKRFVSGDDPRKRLILWAFVLKQF